MKINFRSATTGLVLLVILVGGILVLKMKKPQKPVGPMPQPPIPAGIGVYQSILKVRGPDSAPIKLIEYSDFTCPSCRFAEEVIHQLLESYPDQIQVVYYHFPLVSHRWSIYAHQAAECMNAQGKFWSYYGTLYGKQQEWAISQTPPVEWLLQYAKETGADIDRFSKCLSDTAVSRAIYSEKEEGIRQNVNATPTFFIGDQRFVGARELKERGENVIRTILGLPPTPPLTEPPASPPAASPVPASEQKGI